MRSYLGLVFISLAIGATACTIQNNETKGSGGGATTTTTGAGAGGGGTGGAGPCGEVPVLGECATATTIKSCVVSEESGVDPKVLEVTCKAGTQCQMVNGAAACKPIGDCFDGDTRCATASTLETCVSGKWQSTDCGGGNSCSAHPGQGATCALQEAGTGIKLRGHLEYEFRKPNAALTDFSSTVSQEAAVDFFVTVYDGSDLIGMGLTSPGGNGMNPGDWEVELSKQPTDQTFYYFWPMLFDDNGNPRMAIAHAESDAADHQASTEYWSWGFGPVCDAPGACNTTDTGNQLIDEASGSGAAHIYQWIDYGIFRVADLLPNETPLTVSVFWEPGIKFDCGSCFAPPQMGGANVTYDKANDLVDHYESSLNIAGSDASPHHWSRTTINHEFGHWLMQSYSRSPGEGGVHYVDEASRPGLSYSEGWATFSGQTNISNSPADNDPIAFRKSNGTVFWVDLSKLTWSGGALELPDAEGPMDQYVNENVISAMMWSLWASQHAKNPQSLGDAPLYQVLRSNRLLQGPNRGYPTVDFIDYLDALKCENLATASQIGAVTTPVGYPYDNAEVCQ